MEKYYWNLTVEKFTTYTTLFLGPYPTKNILFMYIFIKSIINTQNKLFPQK